MNQLRPAQRVPGSLRRLLTEPARPARVRTSPRAHWYVVATVCIGAFMGQLDASIVTVALPRLGSDLHAGVGVVEWVALAYLLVLVATVATVGRIADAVGRKLLYVYGFGVFTAGSALCGLAPTLAVLIGARVLQAVGAAMLQANSVALIAEAVPRQLLGRAVGVQGTAQALGLALGPAVGGALLAIGGWRLIFVANLPAGVIGLALGWLLLPRSRTRRAVGDRDHVGAVLLAVSAAAPLLYLSLASRAGYGDRLLLMVLVGGALAAVWFVRHERRVQTPLIELSLFRRPELSIGLSSGLVSYLVLFGTLFVVPYYLSATHAGSALAGVQLAVLPVAIGIAAPIAGRLLTRVGDRPLTGGGLALTAAGLLEIALRLGTPGLLVGLALAGFGLGAFTPANNATVMSAAPPGHTGVVSGVLNMGRGMGTALGVALASAVYAAAAGPTAANAANGLTVTLGALSCVALAVGLALLLDRDATTAAARRRQRARPGASWLGARSRNGPVRRSGVAFRDRSGGANTRVSPARASTAVGSRRRAHLEPPHRSLHISTPTAYPGGSVMSQSLDPTMRHQIERNIDDLCIEFAGKFDRRQIEEVMNDSVELVVETARVFDFVPLMAYRFTRERLNAIKRARGQKAEGAWDVVFVSLSGGGRGQIAAALTTRLSENLVSVHSAGTAVHGQVDPGVRTVIAELDIDPDDAFARPVTDEVLRAADVIVTMGHSVGVIDTPPGIRRQDWRIGDPIGAPIAEIRRVRADIEYRVRALLTDLGVPIVKHSKR